MIFDYVVVGSGSAGSALAGRLAESGRFEVAVLEAGGPDDLDLIDIPAAFPQLFKSAVDWNFATEPQKQLHGRVDYVPRGKTFGGSSSVNAQVVQRGAHGCYDEWAARGNKGWAWADVFGLFKGMENNERGASAWHGVGGPMNVADLRDPHPLSLAMLTAATECGFDLNDDFNGADQLGFGLHQVNHKDGMRWSTARGYLHPALAAGSLTAIPFAHATRLMFTGTRCTGVAYRDAAGVERCVNARREVIVSAGAIGSPHLLLLSGIGGRDQLGRFGIDVVVDAPGVGAELHDHPVVPVNYHCTTPITMAAAGTEEQAARFANERMGMLTSNVVEAGGFLQVRDGSVPDLQFHFAPTFFLHHGASNPDGHGFVGFAAAVQPRSFGRLELRSADPLDKPVIDPNLLDSQDDLDLLIHGVRIVQDILGAPVLAEFRGAPYPATAGARSDDELGEYVRTSVQNMYHPVGTCRMGQDATAVVDHELRVNGVEGLRVADASVMPYIVNANTNFPSIMIGEKCAELILSNS